MPGMDEEKQTLLYAGSSTPRDSQRARAFLTASLALAILLFLVVAWWISLPTFEEPIR